MPALTLHNAHLFFWISVAGAIGGAMTFIVSFELVSRMDR